MSNAATRSFSLVRSEAGREQYQYFGALRVRVDVVDAVHFDPHIFVYRRDMVSPYSPDSPPTDTFFTVASPADMAEYPINNPDPLKAFPFFRKRVVELDFRSTLHADQFWQVVVQEAAVLLHAFNKLEVLGHAETVPVGPFPEDVEPEDNSLSVPG